MAMATTTSPWTWDACRSLCVTDGPDSVVGRQGELKRPVAIGLGGDLLPCRRPAAAVRHCGRVPVGCTASGPVVQGGIATAGGRRRPADVALSWLGNPADKLTWQYLRPCRSEIAGRGRRHVASANPKVVVASSSGVESQSGSQSTQTVPDTEFSITKVSFGTIGLAVGVSFLTFGFGAYFNLLPGAEWSAILLTYGFPLTLIGFALKYAELKPVPCISYVDAYALRASQATPTLTQVREDVTRFRYGDEQHLDEALKRIFRYGLAGGIQRRFAPTLTAVREEVVNGQYTLVLIFSAPSLKLEDFESRQEKFSSFFGPGVTAEMLQAGDKVYEVKLIANGGKTVA